MWASNSSEIDELADGKDRFIAACPIIAFMAKDGQQRPCGRPNTQSRTMFAR